jgi:two-component system, LytTR family, response regulator
MTDARLRVVVVDDEALARSVLREYLANVPDIDVIAECANGFEAVKAVAELQPDLMFLDVQMPKLDGFEVLELVERDVAVVFVTAYDQYALKAFEVHAVDYLLKPFGPERLTEALQRVRARLAQKEPGAEPLAARLQSGRRPLTRVLIRDGAAVHIVPLSKIDYAEAQDDYVAIHAEKRTYLKEQTMAQLEGMLDPRQFVRIHRSYLLNVDRLAKIDATDTDSRVAILRDDTRLPVSRSGYTRLSALLGE